MVTIIDMLIKKSHDYPELTADVDGVAKALVRFKDEVAKTSSKERRIAMAYSPTKQLSVLVAEAVDGR